MSNDLRILVVDDTVTDRQIMSKIITGIPNVELIGTAPNGKIALTKIGLTRPDLVLLDLVMPEMDGLETLTRIREQFPNTDVIIVSGIDQENAKMTVQALEYGALDFIPKPRTSSPEESIRELRASLGRLIPIAQTRKYSRRVKNISEEKLRPYLIQNLKEAVVADQEDLKVEIIRHPIEKIPFQSPAIQRKPVRTTPVNPRKPGKIDIVAIGVSTGGPNALQEIIPKIEPNFPVPIVAVQHMPPMFTASLAARLNNESKIIVVEGQEGMPVENSHMYIAPGGRHMVVRREKSEILIGIVDSPPVNSCKPAADVLFRSLAVVYGGNILTTVLTGMGNDGSSGVSAIRRKGGYSLVQDEKSSVVWGMPGSVAEAGQADEIVPLNQIAQRIMAIVKGIPS